LHSAELHLRSALTNLVWRLIAFMTVATLVSFLFAGITVDPSSNLPLLLGIALLFLLAWFYRTVRPSPELSDVCNAGGQLLLILLFGILLTYAASAAAFPYRDAELYAIDQALGLDRQKYLAFFHAQPAVEKALEIAYLSFLPQFALMPLVLFVANQMARLRQLMLASGIALLLTSAIFVFTPAVDAFVYVDITLPVFANAAGKIYTHVPTMEALRVGTLHAIRLDNLEALVTFPSFHTTAALMFAWALWTVPYCRWPAVMLNACLIAATPLVGAHYFIDLAGGTIVAAIAIYASDHLCRRASSTAQPAERVTSNA
jgi:membrane-associated phospholipid phosphatase